jgi:hypothetical protein
VPENYGRTKADECPSRIFAAGGVQPWDFVDLH